jgi:hypothetical protein
MQYVTNRVSLPKKLREMLDKHDSSIYSIPLLSYQERSWCTLFWSAKTCGIVPTAYRVLEKEAYSEFLTELVKKPEINIKRAGREKMHKLGWIHLYAEVDKVEDPRLERAIQGKPRVYIASLSIQTGRDKETWVERRTLIEIINLGSPVGSEKQQQWCLRQLSVSSRCGLRDFTCLLLCHLFQYTH